MFRIYQLGFFLESLKRTAKSVLFLCPYSKKTICSYRLIHMNIIFKLFLELYYFKIDLIWGV